MSPNIIIKPKRSIGLSGKQIKYLKEKITQYAGSKTAAGISLGISKDVLDRTIAFGSCSEKTYNILFPQETVESTGVKEKQVA